MVKHSKPKLIITTTTIKRKRVGKRDANTKITLACVIEEEIEEFSEKPLRHPPSGKMIH